MKRIALIGLAALAFGVVPAQPAFAQEGFIRWLEKLSGPGPFVGAGLEIYGRCYGYRKDSPIAADSTAKEASWFWEPNCGSAARNRTRLTFGVQFSRLAGDNNLQYDDTVPDEHTKTVGASIFMGTADLGVHRALELGSAVGLIHFTGTPPGAFSRLLLEPVRVTWKPLAMKPLRDGDDPREVYRREWLQLRLVMTVIPGGFDAEDFGAIPGTFKSGTEVQGNMYVIVNVANLLGW